MPFHFSHELRRPSLFHDAVTAKKYKLKKSLADVFGAWRSSMVWRVRIAIICLFAIGAGAAYAAEGLTCERIAVNWKWQEFRCPVTINTVGQKMHFKADFSGSHDDTRLSMTFSLDGVPVECSPDSKTSLIGEDGNVSLECHFVPGGTPGTKSVLNAIVQIWHAELDAITLSSP
jgi:hypothetical protein